MAASLSKLYLSGNMKWTPQVHPPKVLDDESLPESDYSSFSSECGSVNEEDVCIKKLETIAQECTVVKRTMFIQKNLRAERASCCLEKLVKCLVFKLKVRMLVWKNQELDRIYFNVQARKITKLLRSFMEKKKIVTAEILEKYKEHCVVYIQKYWKGFLTRKKIKKAKEKIRSGIVGWKVRKIMKFPDLILLKNKAKASFSPDIIQDFINFFHLLYEGRWAKKYPQVPKHHKILYKNTTMRLKASHERRTSASSQADSNKSRNSPKNLTSPQKKVKFALKISETPKETEINPLSKPLKGILKRNQTPEPIDSEEFQQQLDFIFYESEARFETEGYDDEFHDNSCKKLLFKRKFQETSTILKEKIQNWDLNEFESACEADQSALTLFAPISIATQIPHLTFFSIFFQCERSSDFYAKLKKEYQNLRHNT